LQHDVRRLRGRRAMSRLRAPLAALFLLGASACNTYTYFEIDTELDPLTISTEEAGMISTCRVTVEGAARDDFYIKRYCPPPSGSSKIGIFEYATFADGGEIKFTLRLFSGVGQTNQIGEGTLSVPVESGMTISRTLKAFGK
jgi:hypothetical protein